MPLHDPQPLASIDQLQAAIAALKSETTELTAGLRTYEQKAMRSRKWNGWAIGIVVALCAFGWLYDGSAWLRWGALPVILASTALFEVMRHFWTQRMRAELQRLQDQVAEFETQLQAQQAPAPVQPATALPA